MHISMTRDDLIERLKDRLAAAKADDARIARLHQADEAKALEKFRAACREAMKWDYAKVKKKNFDVDFAYSARPACPRLQHPAIAVQIRMVELDSRKGPFSIGKGTELYDAVMWQPANERAAKTVCD